ncbi:ubiquitin carboxyl-terminal hydrolase [Xylariaceae sp. FL0016]|nr:ubiquitin carboxyl-terminal hydrolase [Xylariaceae sp. FL0016]
MDNQDPNPTDRRDRAFSSEPSSTRPNPFDDGDESARKRRRTSPSPSRSSSVETLPPVNANLPPLASDTNAMKVDSPEPTAPSTPARSQTPAEPKSSKVTINLRNAESRESTPASPTSPTPARRRLDDVKVSVEASDVAMRQTCQSEAPSSPSELDVLEEDPAGVPEISVDDIEYGVLQRNAIGLDTRAVLFESILQDFPYRTDSEALQETLHRLVGYFRQRRSQDILFVIEQGSDKYLEPPNADEALGALHQWLQTYLANAHHDFYSVVVEAHREHRFFWNHLPELFNIIANRQTLPKGRETRDIVTPLFNLFARMTAFLLSIDVMTLSNVVISEGADLDLVSPPFLRVLGCATTPRDEPNGYGAESQSQLVESLQVFQSINPSLHNLGRFVELNASILPRFPKKSMDHLASSCVLWEGIARESYQVQTFHAGVSRAILERCHSILNLVHDCFNTTSRALEEMLGKSINILPIDSAVIIMQYLSNLLRWSLHGKHNDAIELLQRYSREHSELPALFVHETVALEWRFRLFCRLIRSGQMQLRVLAVSQMCDDLVNQWRRYNDRIDGPQENNAHWSFLEYLASYIMSTGIVEYLLGPTCHPEITQSSYNIVGFLGVTKTYRIEHTDYVWQTFTSTQDPRVSEALAKLMGKVLPLVESHHLVHLLGKFQQVSIDSFTPVMRDFFDSLTEQALRSQLPVAAYDICVRLIRESSIYGAQGSIAYPEIHQFASNKFKKLLGFGPGQNGRGHILDVCLDDIKVKSPMTLGSVSVVSTMATGPSGAHVLKGLVEERDLTRLLVDELESTTKAAQAAGLIPIYAHNISAPRRRLIFSIITQHGSTLGPDLGRRLWDLLVGRDALCQEDRWLAWEDLNQAMKQTRFDDPFISACLHEYLPRLHPSCYCTGALTFVRGALLPCVNDVNGVILDDEESVKTAGLELLWHMILTAPTHTIEDTAILTLVNDIYVDSKAIMSYPLQRARKVHFALVQRCLQQLKSAASRLRGFTDGSMSGDDEPMVIVATDAQEREQELQFTRTLKVLITLLRTLQTRSHFAAPDLRSLMLQSPSAMAGESANIKYQAFDGDFQSDVNPLNIGLDNSAASLLASLREATGFENFRLYYRGQPLVPSDTDICRSVDELNVKNGLILVKRELELASSPVRIKPGASSLDIEILGHFEDLWGYLSMEERLAQEIYHFLVTLPADDSILGMLEDPNTSHRDAFPLGQPFKSLYTIHALREYLSTRRLRKSVMQPVSQDTKDRQQTVQDQDDALVKAVSLIVAAICDTEVLGQCQSEDIRLLLSHQLVDNFAQLLKETMELPAISQFLTPILHERLWAILSSGATAETSPMSVDLVQRCFEALLECCTKSQDFWTIFKSQPTVQNVVKTLLLTDERPFVRKNIAKLISTKSFYNSGPSGVLATDFAELFWPLVSQLLPQAATAPTRCEEVFNLSFHLLKKLTEADSNVIDLPACLSECGKLLLRHIPTEDISHPEHIDLVSYGLINILQAGLKYLSAKQHNTRFPAKFATLLFSTKLFPSEDENGPLVPRVVLYSTSRSMLYEIMLLLTKDDPSQWLSLLDALSNLTSFRELEDGDEEYMFEVPHVYDRSTSVRSPCGYAGLRNLSNTCYLNSLFTQLFMNIEFRRFMLRVRISGSRSHELLAETKSLFANLQDSRRRFIDPSACVAQIMTYDELPIDIHNQMDVDEFYSLLFDRWEAQLSSELDKKALRSIFGGQLVQQVKSQECEHISERIEPFSAIQCDIKGKNSLHESLQAYVDGEIMEGDNKYKCSDCDRHVDAVKRACLKDIPDHLIFHLKRFDFNLRTLQRSKINDYFSFPDTIDMQPYTIEHLSDPLGNTESDLFELVGILVHSGTAETGHYYSFIRERPSPHSGTSWIEFNDEVVQGWDPSQMEHACFGGSEFRPAYDAGGSYEKVYSAYMLLYSRSSSLKKEQDRVRGSGDLYSFRAPLPSGLEYQVKGDNWAMVHRHCLFDPTHLPFVERVLGITWGTQCSKAHAAETLAMRIALGHLDQVASRTKETPDFSLLKNLVLKACQRCATCCFTFFSYFDRHPETLRMLLVRNHDQSVRHHTGKALISVLASIKQNYPETYGLLNVDQGTMPKQTNLDLTVLKKTVKLFSHIWDTIYTRIVCWPEYFGTILEFAKLGRVEASALLDQDYLHHLLLVICADQQLSDVPVPYQKLASVLSRRMATRPPNYENVIGLVDVLLSFMEIDGHDCSESPRGRLAAALRGDLVHLTATEINDLHKLWDRTLVNVFVEKLIQINQNHAATDSIIQRLMGFGSTMDDSIFQTLRTGIAGQLTTQIVTPFLCTALCYCRLSTNQANVHQLIAHVSNQCRNIQNAEGRSFLDFLEHVYETERNTGEDEEILRIQCLNDIPNWAPSLLGSPDHSISLDLENYLHEKIFRYGPSTSSGRSHGDSLWADTMISCARRLAIQCLLYLRETYVARAVQAVRDTVGPMDRIIKRCDVYFHDSEDEGDSLDSQYRALRHTVLGSMERLTVDDLEEDGSGMWSDSSTATVDQS